MIVILLISVVLSGLGGLWLIWYAQRRIGSQPVCGHCQYNLTGAESNRCPECGRLFIEAGVVLGSRRSLGLRWVGLALILAAPLLGVVSLSVHNTRQAAEARAQLAAERAKQQAFYRRMEQVITAVDGPNQWTSFKEFFPTTKLADDGE